MRCRNVEMATGPRSLIPGGHPGEHHDPEWEQLEVACEDGGALRVDHVLAREGPLNDDLQRRDARRSLTTLLLGGPPTWHAHFPKAFISNFYCQTSSAFCLPDRSTST